MNKTCETCRWWERWGSEFGGCHRLPPVTPNFNVTARKPGGYGSDAVEVVMQSISRPLWPNTSQSDWCGEHQPKDTPDGK